jgi:hypothetical protein
VARATSIDISPQGQRHLRQAPILFFDASFAAGIRVALHARVEGANKFNLSGFDASAALGDGQSPSSVADRVVITERYRTQNIANA